MGEIPQRKKGEDELMTITEILLSIVGFFCLAFAVILYLATEGVNEIIRFFNKKGDKDERQ